MLIVADAHFGKIQHFRKAGFPLPESVSGENYKRLDKMIETVQPKTLLFLGDLFHSRKNSDWDIFKSWRSMNKGIHFILVRGNHDLFTREFYENSGLEIHEDEFTQGEFTFRHDPPQNHQDSKYVIAGHIHPYVLMRGNGNQQLRAPAFVFCADQALMPAFGSFTGGKIIRPNAKDKIFVVSGTEVLNVNTAA